MVKTIVDEANDKTIMVPVYDAAAEQFQSTPAKVDNTILRQLFHRNDLESLIIVKMPDRSEDTSLLRPRTFEDGVKRDLAFSSGDTYYFADRNLRDKIGQFFESEPDTACRYGSLLSSNCYESVTRLPNVKVKIVDFTDPQYAEFKTGDCHGKASLRLAQELGGAADKPFQFRFAWNKARFDDGKGTAPDPSFLAKGTLTVAAALTSDHEGEYDLILDRSSIKGIKKSELKDLLPCGDYVFPRAVLGNRQNAEATEYNNSWQFTSCFSPAAIAKDFGPATQAEAEYLAQLQDNPIALKKHILVEYDKQKEKQTEAARERWQESKGADAGEDTEPDFSKADAAMIRHMKADTRHEYLTSPKVAEYMKRYLKKKWANLAINGGYKHSSGMAQPTDLLQPGQVCIPHLPTGEVIVTRNPIPSIDNIRRYENVHIPELCQKKNTVWMRPDEAEKHHQADFDGDQMVVDHVSRLPNIAREVSKANGPNQFESVSQRPKLSYVDVLATKGEPTTMAHIAIAASQNKVGIVAKRIGQVMSAEPSEVEARNPDAISGFKEEQKQYLNRLIKAMQVEVDYGKNAERLEDVKEFDGEDLLKDTDEWLSKHPVEFFDVYKHEKLYDRFPMQVQGNASVNVLPKMVDPLWKETELQVLPRREFQGMFKCPANVEPERWQDYLDAARDLKDRFKADSDLIRDRNQGDGKKIREEIGKLYEPYQKELDETYTTVGSRRLFQMALNHTQHTDDSTHTVDREACLKWAKDRPAMFCAEPAYSLPDAALPVDCHILSAPFGDGTQGAETFKTKLEAKGIPFKAKLRDDIPFVDFVLTDLSPTVINRLTERYGLEREDKDGKVTYHDDRLTTAKDVTKAGIERVAPPLHYDEWAEPARETGKGALAYNLMLDAFAINMEKRKIHEITVTGLQYNEFKQEPFTNPQWNESVPVTVGQIKLDPSDPKFATLHNRPCLEIDGQRLGTFGQGSAKLPVGTTFSAYVVREGNSAKLQVEDASIQVPDPDLPQRPKPPQVSQRREKQSDFTPVAPTRPFKAQVQAGDSENAADFPDTPDRAQSPHISVSRMRTPRRVKQMEA